MVSHNGIQRPRGNVSKRFVLRPKQYFLNVSPRLWMRGTVLCYVCVLIYVVGWKLPSNQTPEINQSPTTLSPQQPNKEDPMVVVVVETISRGNGPPITQGKRYRSMVTLYIELPQQPINLINHKLKNLKKKPSGWSTRVEHGGNGEPFLFQPGQYLIPGWTQGVLQMHQGDRAWIHVPATLGYGSDGMGSPEGDFYVPPDSSLLFDIEIFRDDELDEEIDHGGLRKANQPHYHYKPRHGKDADEQHKLAIIIPFRDAPYDTASQGAGRKENLKEWIEYMQDFLRDHHPKKKKKKKWEEENPILLLIIEQTQDSGPFNKGFLFNVGFDIAMTDHNPPPEYFILHDVDQIPLDPLNDYSYREQATKLIATTKRKKTRLGDYEDRPLGKSNVGGVLLIPSSVYQKVNGYSNKFGGWGLEDNNMAQRLRHAGEKHKILEPSIGRYQELYHDRLEGLDQNDQYAKNFNHQNDFESGLRTLDYAIVQEGEPYMAGTRLLVQRFVVEENHKKKNSGSGDHIMNPQAERWKGRWPRIPVEEGEVDIRWKDRWPRIPVEEGEVDIELIDDVDDGQW